MHGSTEIPGALKRQDSFFPITKPRDIVATASKTVGASAESLDSHSTAAKTPKPPKLVNPHYSRLASETPDGDAEPVWPDVLPPLVLADPRGFLRGGAFIGLFKTVFYNEFNEITDKPAKINELSH
ncbi:MAG: hypothetical protein Q7V63_03870 [Gammaproteobacteria bacterium]|nr:hypothetical protein [Gammaproteobacteria bacterium]